MLKQIQHSQIFFFLKGGGGGGVTYASQYSVQKIFFLTCLHIAVCSMYVHMQTALEIHWLSCRYVNCQQKHPSRCESACSVEMGCDDSPGRWIGCIL